MRKLLTAFLLLSSLFASSQAYIHKDTSYAIGGQTYTARMSYYPTDDSVAVIFSMPGLGEVGTDPANLVKYGPHYWFNNGFNGEVVLPNGTHRPYYITLLVPTSYHRPWQLINSVNAMLTRFPNIKRNARFAGGLSMGSWEWMILSSYKPNDTDFSYYFTFNALINIQGVNPSDRYNSTLPHPDRYGNWASVRGGKFLGFEQVNDARNIHQIRNNMNDSVPGSAHLIYTNFGSGGHSNFNDFWNPAQNNWTTSNPNTVDVKGTQSSNYIDAGLNVYQWLLLQGDTTLGPPPPPNPIEISTVGDTTYIWQQGNEFNKPITLSAEVTNGVPTAWTWTRVSGPNSPTINNSSQRISNITGYVPGYYTFQVVATDGTNSDTKTVVLWVRDLMKKDLTTPRPVPQIFDLGDITGNGVNATTIYVPYLNTYFQNRYGTTPRAGDTIRLHRNPNNSGRWANVEIGDIYGGEEAPVTIVPHGGTVWIGGATNSYWRLGIRDSNMVAHVKIHGLHYHDKDSTASPYGFHVDRSGHPAGTGYGIVANIFHNLTVNGIYIDNADVGMFMKVNSDSSKIFKYFDNVRFKNVHLHDLYLKNIYGEAFYVGHTDISGTAQVPLNSGPTVRGDSILVERIIINGSGWDGFQLSNWGYGNIVRNMALYRTGFRNVSSQQWGAFIGGASQGDMYNVASYNSTGASGTLGQGNVRLYNMYIDSVNNNVPHDAYITEDNDRLYVWISGSWQYQSGEPSVNINFKGTVPTVADLPPTDNKGQTLNNADGIYSHQSNGGVIAVYGVVDSLKVFSENNYIGNTTRWGIYHANVNTTMKAGAIRNNYFLSGGNSGASSAVGDTIANNTTGPLGPESMFGDSSFYKVIQLVRQYPDSLVSFFSVEGEPSPEPNPPTVLAGSDQTITLPTNSVSLSGSVTPGDGASIVSVLWAKQSGGTATITTPSSLNTTVTGLTEGTYVFRLTATDDYSQSSYDEVTITVDAEPVIPNPPTVHAGADQLIYLPTSATTLEGVAIPNGDATITSTLWSKQSGSSGGSITSASSLTTGITGLQAGIYVYRLTATDNYSQTEYSDVVVTVSNPPTPNPPPIVFAGNDISVTLPTNSVSLIGTATAQGDASITSTVWSKTSGPSGGVIGDPSDLATTATSLQVGMYVFRLTAMDSNDESAFDEVTITVYPEPINPDDKIKLPVKKRQRVFVVKGQNTEEVNVLQFQDVASNDREMIQMAVDYAHASGINNVYVPAGTYMINAEGSFLLGGILLRDNTNFRMHSSAKLKALPSSKDYYNILTVNSVSNVSITGGTIEGERYEHVGSTGEGGMGITLVHAENVRIDNVTLKDCWGDGIYIRGKSKNVTITNAVMDNNRRQGMSVISCDGLVNINNVYKNTNGKSPQCGVDLEPNNMNDTVTNVVFDNCLFENNARYGLFMYGKYGVVSNVSVRNCTMDGGYRGLVLRYPKVTEIDVQNLTVTGTTEYGFHAYDTVTNVVVNGMDITTAAGAGVRLEYAEGFDIVNLNIKAHSSGFSTNRSKSVDVENAKIEPFAPSGNGVYLVQSEDISLQNLEVSGWAYGVNAVSTNYINLANSFIANNTTYGAYISNSQNSIFEANRFDGNRQIGFYIRSGGNGYNEILKNEFINNGYQTNNTYPHAVIAESARRNTLSGNIFRTSTQTNKPNYAVRLDNTTSFNTVTGNTYEVGSYVTGTVQDEGTNNTIEP